MPAIQEIDLSDGQNANWISSREKEERDGETKRERERGRGG